MTAATITVQEATRISGLSRTAIFNLLKDGALASLKQRGRRLILVDSLADLSRRTQPSRRLPDEAAIAIDMIEAAGLDHADFRPFLRSWLDRGGTIAVQGDALVMKIRAPLSASRSGG